MYSRLPEINNCPGAWMLYFQGEISVNLWDIFAHRMKILAFWKGLITLNHMEFILTGQTLHFNHAHIIYCFCKFSWALIRIINEAIRHRRK